MTGTVQFDCADRLGSVTLDHPERRNALTETMLSSIADEVPRLARDGARALVVRGAGKSFCGGYDLTRLASCGDGAGYADEDHPLMRALDAIEQFPGPTVAGLQGHTVGGGCLLAMSCDLRYAAEGVKWSIPATRLGVVYPERGIRRLVALVGLGRALEILLVADPIEADVALRWGLFNDVDTRGLFEDRLHERLIRLARRSPLAVDGIHTIVRRAVLPALEHEVRRAIDVVTGAALTSEDVVEGLAALTQRRLPAFRGR